MSCSCFIVPPKVMRKLSRDQALTAKQREAFRDMIKFEAQWRAARIAATEAHFIASRTLAGKVTLASSPAITVYDCGNGVSLPGSQVANPGGSKDVTVRRTFRETTAVADFFQKVFNRNSIDDGGMSLLSSVHYGVAYNNAFWNGTQMTYGDGDGKIFTDFTAADDVICHELTHGVTQFTLALGYTDEAGGLNESISDVFGSMFRQWNAKHSVTKADWLIGSDIMGPLATAKGYTCLRDMANPSAKHCLAPQPKHFSQFQPSMDPHESSGIPNFAFYKAATAIGGNSWDRTGQIWYKAITALPATPGLRMQAFADATRSAAAKLYPKDAAVAAAIDTGWKDVGL